MGRGEILIASFTAVNLMDYLTTIQGIHMGFHELNSLVASMSPVVFLMFKFMIIVSVSAAYFALRNFKTHILRGIYAGIVIGVAISTVFIGLVAVHNILLLAGFPEIEVLTAFMLKILI